jgi:hypothetical protein
MTQQNEQAGIDMRSPCTASAAKCLFLNGIQFVGRYYTSIPGDSKLLTLAEAQTISASGLTIVSVYEDDGTTFSAALGTENANTALEQAGAVGQSPGSAIYFAVDYDADADDLAHDIIPYFAAVSAQFAGQYAVGVYGSGFVCASALNAGYASYAWLSMSTSFRGSSTFAGWSIRQEPTTTLCNLSVDPDVAIPPFGTFSVAAQF